MRRTDMKKIKRILAAVLAALTVLCCVPSCEKNDYAMKIGDITISQKQYKAIAMSLKSQFLTENGVEETDEMWDKYVDSTYSATMQEYLDAHIQSYIIKYAIYSQHFDKLGLKLDSETEKMIKTTIETLEKQYGGTDKFKEALEEAGYDYDQFIDQYYNEAKETAVIMHYFGPESKINPTPRKDIREYYNEYYSKVKHIFFSTRDEETNDYSNEEKAKIGEKANAVYDRVAAGEDFEKLLDEFNEDPGMASNPEGYIFSKEDTSYVPLFTQTAFEMQAGDVRIIQTYMGYHIMKKYAFTEEDAFAPENEKMLIENMKSAEATELLDDLKEEIGVKYNDTVLAELSVVNLPKTNEAVDPTDEIKDQLSDLADEVKK